MNGAAQVPIGLILSSTGQPESAAAYTATLQVRVSSTFHEVTHTQNLVVSLVVQSRTSFAVWGRVAPGTLCVLVTDKTSNGTTTTGVVRLVPFTACDCDHLPVAHPLPSRGDTRPFSGRLTASDHTQPNPRIHYLGSGAYETFLDVPSHGGFTLAILLHDVEILRFSGSATCQAGRVPLADSTCGCPAGFEPGSANELQCKPCDAGRFKASPGAMQCVVCGIGTYQPKEGSSACVPCSAGTHQPGQGAAECRRCELGQSSPVGSDRCNICAADFYRPNAYSPTSLCTSCDGLQGVSCRVNATTETLEINEGYYRFSPSTPRTYKCDVQNNRTACLSNSVCRAGHGGPLCKVCLEEKEYYHEASCEDCPQAGSGFAAVVATVATALLFGVALKRILASRSKVCAWLADPLRRWVRQVSTFCELVGVVTKLKLAMNFMQVVATLHITHSLNLPDTWFRWVLPRNLNPALLQL